MNKVYRFALSARTFFTFVHFFVVVSKTKTWNRQICGFYEESQHLRINFHFLH